MKKFFSVRFNIYSLQEFLW